MLWVCPCDSKPCCVSISCSSSPVTTIVSSQFLHPFWINWKCDFVSVSASGKFIPWEIRKGIAGKTLSMCLNVIDVDLCVLKPWELLPSVGLNEGFWKKENWSPLVRALRWKCTLGGGIISRSCCWCCCEHYLGYTFSFSKYVIWRFLQFSKVFFSPVVIWGFFPLFFLSCGRLCSFNKVLKLTLLWDSDIWAEEVHTSLVWASSCDFGGGRSCDEDVEEHRIKAPRSRFNLCGFPSCEPLANERLMQSPYNHLENRYPLGSIWIN